jgi:putative intracellular protease/amidase
MNKENILKAAAALEKSDEYFSMGSMQTCIHGFVDRTFRDVNNQNELGYLVFTADFLDLDEKEYEALILPKGWDTQPTQYPKEKAVAVLRKMAETGKVDWS